MTNNDESNWIRDAHVALDALPPSAWRICACALIVLGTLWTLTLSRESVFRGAPSQRWWWDLRLWSCLVAAPYALIYLFLF